jgi:hypothetical protein
MKFCDLFAALARQRTVPVKWATPSRPLSISRKNEGYKTPCRHAIFFETPAFPEPNWRDYYPLSVAGP